MLVLNWFLKQSYFAIVLFISVPVEFFGAIMNKKEWKKHLLYTVVLLLCLGGTLFSSIKIWTNLTKPSEGRNLLKMVTDLRYFQPENIYLEGKQRVSIKDNEYNEISSFNYNYKNTVDNYLVYMAKCFRENPERVIRGYWDNYLTICDIYYRPMEENINYAYGKIVKGNIWNNILGNINDISISSENRTLILNSVKANLDNTETIRGTEESLKKMGIFSEKVKNYYFRTGDNFVIKFITNPFGSAIACLLFSLLTFFSPVIFFYCFIKGVRENKLEYYAPEIIISLFSTLYILMNTITGAVIDRYIIQTYLGNMLIVIIYIQKKCITKNNITLSANKVSITEKDNIKLLIIIPAYNEAENIINVINNLKKNCPQYDYVIVNDGSKDNTALLCQEYHFNYLDLSVNCGLSGAVQAGMRYAVRMGYDAVVQYDGDGQHRAEYIENLLITLENEDCDIVVGSRFVTEKKPFSMRMMGSCIISWCIKFTTGFKMTDPTSGMRIFNKRMMHEFAYNMNHGPEPDTISYLIKQKGIRVKEIQVKMDERVAGESYLNIMRSVEYMVSICFSIIFIQQFRKDK